MSREQQVQMVHELFPGTPLLFSVLFQNPDPEQDIIVGVPYLTRGYILYVAELKNNNYLQRTRECALQA